MTMRRSKVMHCMYRLQYRKHGKWENGTLFATHSAANDAGRKTGKHFQVVPEQIEVKIPCVPSPGAIHH